MLHLHNSNSTDPRPVHIKLARIAGRTHFISVLPPGPEKHNETVWAVSRASQDNPNKQQKQYNGLQDLIDYAASKEDLG